MMLVVFLVIFNSFNLFIGGYSENTNNIEKPPHIIFILADDLGWNDVSFHGSDEIFTPNIDALAYNGVILKNHYSETLCSPSRAALLTGKYPIHTGMHHNVVMETQASGLPLEEKIFPQYLKPLGYKTHAVGKWHLGFYKKEYTPPYRGFDSFYGLWNGYHDYYRHNVQAWFIPYDGYDMRRNTSIDWSAFGKYSTDLFTDEAVNIIENHDNSEPLFLYLAHLAPHAGTYEDPLQAPEEEVDKFSFIEDYDRRRYAAMVSKLDQSIGKVMEALKKNSMLDDSIVVFVSDNGAPTNGLMKNHGSNWPLKGEKSTPWEGGIKTVALVWSKMLQRTKKVNSQLMHISDWLPTLYSAAGGDSGDLIDIDGKNLWDVLSGIKDEYKNYTILHNIDEVSGHGYSALREGSFKLVNGTSLLGYLDFWSGLPQEAPVPEYDPQKVLYSKANRVLSNVTEPLTPTDISTLRSLTKISCKIKYNTKHLHPCLPRKRPCLFNIAEDPCEKYNLYDSSEDMKNIQNKLENAINEFRKTVKAANTETGNQLSNPALYNNTWVNWGDIEEEYSVFGIGL